MVEDSQNRLFAKSYVYQFGFRFAGSVCKLIATFGARGEPGNEVNQVCRT